MIIYVSVNSIWFCLVPAIRWALHCNILANKSCQYLLAAHGIDGPVMGPFQLPQAGLTFPFILRCPIETGGKISSGSISWPYWFPLMSWLMLRLRIPKKVRGVVGEFESEFGLQLGQGDRPCIDRLGCSHLFCYALRSTFVAEFQM